MTASFTNPTIKRISNATETYPAQTALLAVALSVVLHIWFAMTYHSGPIEPLQNKPPKVIEVALVVPPPPPPPPPLPVIKPIVPPPKVIPPPKKPEMEKPKPKPLPKPKPVAPKPETPKPLTKAPPKVVQKTFVEEVPDVEDHPEAKITAPVVSPPPAKPVPTAPPTPAVSKSSSASSGDGQSNKPSSGVVVLERVKPHYPSRALSRHIEGSVTIKFTVSPSGEVEDAVVVSATPEDVFDEAALDAIKQWKFKQKIVNGVSVEQRAVQTLRFTLSN